MSGRKPPLLMRSQLTGKVYVVTAYKVNAAGYVEARTKHDVTDQYEAIVDAARSTTEGDDVL